MRELRRIFLWALAACAAALLAGGCRDGKQPAGQGGQTHHEQPASSPTTQPAGGDPSATLGADWAAFHRGGPLQGLADPIGPPPMKLRWQYRIEGGAGVSNSAAIVGDTVFVADDRSTVHAIDLGDGTPRWTQKFEDGFETAPLVAGGRVMLGDAIGVFHCLSADKGAELWKFDSGAKICSSANLLAGGRVVFGNDGGQITCLDPASGEKVWDRTIERTNGAPAVDGDTVWVASCDGQVHALDAADGHSLTQADIGGPAGAAPLLADGGVIIGRDQGAVLCVDAVTGRVRWTYDRVADEAMVYSSAAFADGVVVVGARDGQVHAIDVKDGRRRWVFPTQGYVDSSPAISGGAGGRGSRVYVASKDGKLYVLNLADGKPLWQFTAGGAISAGPAIGRGVVVFADQAGNVYCLAPK